MKDSIPDDYAEALRQSAKERPDETPCGFWRPISILLDDEREAAL